MIQCRQVAGRNAYEEAYEVTYITPISHGTERFGSREKATLFAVKKLEELRKNHENERTNLNPPG